MKTGLILIMFPFQSKRWRKFWQRYYLHSKFLFNLKIFKRVDLFDEEFSGFDDDESITYREHSSSASALTYELSLPIVLDKLGIFCFK